MPLNPKTIAQVEKIDTMIAELSAKREKLIGIVRENAPKGTSIVEFNDVQYAVKATPKMVFDAKKFEAEHPKDKDDNAKYYETVTKFQPTKVKDREGYLTPGTTAISIERVVKAD